LEECGSCPTFAGFTLAFALQLREKHGKTSVRVKFERLILSNKANDFLYIMHVAAYEMSLVSKSKARTIFYSANVPA
jgi:hypothetical protein